MRRAGRFRAWGVEERRDRGARGTRGEVAKPEGLKWRRGRRRRVAIHGEAVARRGHGGRRKWSGGLEVWEGPRSGLTAARG